MESLGGRCCPNTVAAAAYDLKVFFTVVARPPAGTLSETLTEHYRRARPEALDIPSR